MAAESASNSRNLKLRNSGRFGMVVVGRGSGNA